MQDSNWVEQRREEILAPDLPICDPHHHLWDYPGSRYLLDEVLSDTQSGHNIVSTVYMECGSGYRSEGEEAFRVLGETEFVDDIAQQCLANHAGETEIAKGIVAYADLSLGREVKSVLEAHLALSPERFKGIRHATGWHKSDSVRNSHTNPSEGLMQSDAFYEGFAVLSDLGLSFDAWFYHFQLPEFIALAKSFPDATIILDHFGGPLGIGPYTGKLDDVYLEWRDLIAPLAELNNVHFKLGGLNMKVNGFDWHKQALPPSSDELVDRTARYYEDCIQLFGSARCMFESNFPVDKDSVSYHILWNAFKKITQSYSPKERAALFHDTAAKVYRL